MRSFYVFKRSNGIYYVQFVDPLCGKLLTARSTGKRVYDEAVKQSYDWLLSASICRHKESAAQRFMALAVEKKFTADEIQEIYGAILLYYKNELGMAGIPLSFGQSSVSQTVVNRTYLLGYLKGFWDFDTSDYVQDKIQHGGRIGKKYCYEMTNLVKYWAEFFSDKDTVEELTKKRLQNFEKYLRERRIEKLNKKTGEKVITQLSTTTMSNIMKCGSIALSWAVQTGLILVNPCGGLTSYVITNNERGILTNEEIEKLFARNWKEYRAKVANLLAMSTGMRAGEILALRPCDVKDTYLNVCHSWSDKDGLKCPKNGKARKVPLVAGMKEVLLSLAAQNPHGMSDTSFIFYSTLPDKPTVINYLIDNLTLELRNIGISEAERQERNIVFHSWRHYYATEITKRVEMAQAQAALGHLTPEMTKHYADHKTIEDLEVIGRAANEAFANIIPFMVSA